MSDLTNEELIATRRLHGLNDDLFKEERNIEVGEYVRLARNQGINKTIDKENDRYILESEIEDSYGDIIWFLYEFELKDYIVKHSKQLIDLIEKDDYVNGYKVINVINEEPCPSGKCVDIDSSKDSSECTLWEEDIKTILTKEQYANNCYKVGGEDEKIQIMD